MYRRSILLAAAVWLSVFTSALADKDVIVTADGKLTGKVTQTSSTEITLDQSGVAKTVPVNEVENIYFEDEPMPLRNARNICHSGRYEEALELLDKINADDVERPEIKQELQFYRGLAAARLAIPSGDAAKIKEAGKLLFDFLQANPKTFHFFEAKELVGDLLVAGGKPSAALDFYGEVAKAPWPDYQMRAGVAIGRGMLSQGKPEEALKNFQAVIDNEAKGETADRQRLAAKLGKARCLAETKKTDEAVKLAQEIIDKADAEQTDLNAQAYVILGIAHRQAGRTKEALWALLHVDILYPSEAEAHVEALKNLVPLWKELQKPERAAEAERVLKEQYGKGE